MEKIPPLILNSEGTGFVDRFRDRSDGRLYEVNVRVGNEFYRISVPDGILSEGPRYHCSRQVSDFFLMTTLSYPPPPEPTPPQSDIKFRQTSEEELRYGAYYPYLLELAKTKRIPWRLRDFAGFTRQYPKPYRVPDFERLRVSSVRNKPLADNFLAVRTLPEEGKSGVTHLIKVNLDPTSTDVLSVEVVRVGAGGKVRASTIPEGIYTVEGASSILVTPKD